jgi:hypothetical protein
MKAVIVTDQNQGWFEVAWRCNAGRCAASRRDAALLALAFNENRSSHDCQTLIVERK